MLVLMLEWQGWGWGGEFRGGGGGRKAGLVVRVVVRVEGGLARQVQLHLGGVEQEVPAWKPIGLAAVDLVELMVRL